MINNFKFGMNNLVTSIRQVLNEYGFNYVWLQPETVNHKHFIELFKQRISDCYVHKWRADIESNGVLNVFTCILNRSLKLNFI